MVSSRLLDSVPGKNQSLFSYIADLTKDTEVQKKDSPIKNTDESSLVDRIIELSDLKLGFIEVCKYLGVE
jgi:hypothetical protein